MTDTQWPRYQVFIQEQPGGAYLDAGSVHAPDGELALLNARDVFARRPSVNSVWVVPADAIYSRTRQELEQAERGGQGEGAASPTVLEILPGARESGSSEEETYCVFSKLKAAGTQTLLGTVEAAHPAAALQQAVKRYAGQLAAEKSPFAWWVFPARLVIQSKAQDAGSLFEPALDKPFRLSTDFHTETMMRTIKREET